MVWQCKESGECIDQDTVCDDEVDCVDGSDEEDCCKYYGCFQVYHFSSFFFNVVFYTFGISSLHLLKQCGLDDKSSLSNQKNNANVTNATKMTFVLTLLAQLIAHELLPVVCMKMVRKLGTMLNKKLAHNCSK